MEDKVVNREMLANRREDELKGRKQFKVIRGVPLAEMIRCKVRPLLTKLVNVWKHTNQGVKKTKSMLYIMGKQEGPSKRQTYFPNCQ